MLYGRLFGWQYEAIPMNGMAYEVIRSEGKETGGIMPIPPPAEEHPPAWGVYVTVADVDASANRAEELGGNIHLPPTDIPGAGRFAVLQDPQGAYISIVTYEMK